MSFFEYATAEEHPDDRPAAEGLKESTAKSYARLLRQIGLETKDNEQSLFEEPPDWLSILDWRDDPRKGGKARLETHRRALQWLAAWWGQGGLEAPPFIRRVWATKKTIAKARESGTMRERYKFLRLPSDIETLLGAHPYEAEARTTTAWCRGARYKRAILHRDATWRAMVLLAFYTGSRPGELRTLRLSNYQPLRGGIVGWRQPKDGGVSRDVAIPETFVWHSPHDASLDHYLKHVRPKVATSQSGDAFFLTHTGRPFTESSVLDFVGRGMHLTLGQDSTGGHGLRRACATYRYHYGWTLEEIATLLHDSEAVVASSYIDWTWIRSPQGEPRRAPKPRPKLPHLRPRASWLDRRGELAAKYPTTGAALRRLRSRANQEMLSESTPAIPG